MKYDDILQIFIKEDENIFKPAQDKEIQVRQEKYKEIKKEKYQKKQSKIKPIIDSLEQYFGLKSDFIEFVFADFDKLSFKIGFKTPTGLPFGNSFFIDLFPDNYYRISGPSIRHPGSKTTETNFKFKLNESINLYSEGEEIFKPADKDEQLKRKKFLDDKRKKQIKINNFFDDLNNRDKILPDLLKKLSEYTGLVAEYDVENSKYSSIFYIKFKTPTGIFFGNSWSISYDPSVNAFVSGGSSENYDAVLAKSSFRFVPDISKYDIKLEESIKKTIKDIEYKFLPLIKKLQDEYAKCKEIVYIIAKTAIENGLSNFTVNYGTVTPINPYDNEKGDPVEHYWITEGNDKLIDYASKQFDDEEGELEYKKIESYSPIEFIESEYEQISEESIFKPASTENIAKRKQEYALNKINKILEEHGTQNPDGSWDVNGDVDISDLGLTEIPVKFNKVLGSFFCSYNKLTSLKGVPKEVGGYFNCSDNNLTSLIGAPNKVGGSFYCCFNNLTSLEGAPKEVGDNFYCYKNNLTSLEGAPKEVGGNFYCYNNKVKFTKEDVLKYSKVKKTIYI